MRRFSLVSFLSLGILLFLTIWVQFYHLMILREDSSTITTSIDPKINDSPMASSSKLQDLNLEQLQMTKLTKDNPVYIVMDCMGEFGNYLQFHSHGFGLQHMALTKYGIHTRVVFRRKEGSSNKKAQSAIQKLQECFPNLMDTRLDTTYDPKTSRQLQQDWLGKEIASKLTLNKPHHVEPAALLQTFQALKQAIFQLQEDPPPTASNHTATSSHARQTVPLPFLHVSVMRNFPLMDQQLDLYRNWFQMDEDKCCRDLPEPKEVVFVRPIYVPR